MTLYVDYNQLAGDAELVAEAPSTSLEVGELVLTTDGDASMYARVVSVDEVVHLQPIWSTWNEEGEQPRSVVLRAKSSVASVATSGLAGATRPGIHVVPA